MSSSLKEPPLFLGRWYNANHALQRTRPLRRGCNRTPSWAGSLTCGDLGARVVMLNRPSERANAALSALIQHNLNALFVPCDLQSFENVRRAAAELKTVCAEGIDVLCNNAGVMGLPDMATPDGFDVQMQSNHLSHFLLTAEIWPLLEIAATKRGEARVVNHSSGARRGTTLQTAYFGKNGGHLGGHGFPGFGKWRRLQQSKLANLLFTYALHDHLVAERPAFASKIKSLCAHPGPTDTGLQGKTAKAGGTRLLDQFILWRTLKSAQSTEDGALGIARACCEAGVASRGFYGPTGSGRGGPAELLPPERNAAGAMRSVRFIPPYSAPLHAAGRLCALNVMTSCPAAFELKGVGKWR